MTNDQRATFGSILSLIIVVAYVSASPGCLEIQSQSIKFVQLTTNVKRSMSGISVALNCCPNNQCCSPGIFESGYVFDNSGKCLRQSLISLGGNALTCQENPSANLPSQQRRATVNGVKNGYQLRCMYTNDKDEAFDEVVTVRIKALPQLISLRHEIVERPQRGVLLTCKAAMGSYGIDSVELAFLNHTTDPATSLIGSTRYDEKTSRELSGREKDIAAYLKNELNLDVPNELELKHFIPDHLVFWRNLSVGCHLKLSTREGRIDQEEFLRLDQSKRQSILNEYNLETLPKVELTYDAVSKKLKCSAFSYPRATSIKWSFAVARGQNFSDIPVTNVSAADVISNDWYVSWYNGPFEPKNVYRCVVQNAIGSSVGELEVAPTIAVTTTTEAPSTVAPKVTGGANEYERIWNAHGGPPSPIDAQFPFYWVIVVVGFLIVFAVIIAVILHLRKRAGAEYKAKRGDAVDDEEQQRLQDANTKSGFPDVAGGSSEMTESVKVAGPASPRPAQDGQNKSTDVL